MVGPASVRPASAADSRDCFELFRRSLWDLLRRIGYLRADAPDPDVEGEWPAYVGLFDHLGATCAQWWIAEDAEGRPVGYARATERDGTAELTEFLGAPDSR